ncbi:MAG: HEAT repeat domain-containing protein, partial [Verrucomicrobiota bacterium]
EQFILIESPITSPRKPSQNNAETLNTAPANTIRFKDFEGGWQDRVALEFEIVNDADLTSLRAGLKDEDKLLRTMSARVLGIRGDKESADALADLAENAPEDIVRIRAVESLGLLKMKPNIFKGLKKDPHPGVSWAADLAADQYKSKWALPDFPGDFSLCETGFDLKTTEVEQDISFEALPVSIPAGFLNLELNTVVDPFSRRVTESVLQDGYNSGQMLL